MRKKNIIVVICVLFVFFSDSAVSYSASARKNSKIPMSAGLYIDGKIGINAAETIPGVKNALLMGGPDFGIIGYMPLSDDMNTGAVVELGYTSLPFSTRIDIGGIDIDYVFKYVTVSPQIFISGFTVGVDIGFHSATYINNKETSIYNSATEGIHTAVKLGGMFPVMINNLGTLNISMHGSYSLSGIGIDGDKYKFHPASLSLGLNYMFNLD